MTDPTPWSTRDVARHCGVTEGTVARWVQRGAIPCWHERHKLRFSEAAVKRWWASESKLVREVRR